MLRCVARWAAEVRETRGESKTNAHTDSDTMATGALRFVASANMLGCSHLFPKGDTMMVVVAIEQIRELH